MFKRFENFSFCRLLSSIKSERPKENRLRKPKWLIEIEPHLNGVKTVVFDYCAPIIVMVLFIVHITRLVFA